MENETPAAAGGKKNSKVGLIAGICAGVVAIVGIVVAVILISKGGADPVVGNYEAYSTIKDGKEETTSVSLMKAFGVSITIEFKKDGTGEMVTSTNGSMFSSSEEGESSQPQKEVATFKWKDGKITDMKGSDSEEAKEGTYEYVKEKVDDKDTEFVIVSMSGEEGKEEKVKFKKIEEKKEDK